MKLIHKVAAGGTALLGYGLANAQSAYDAIEAAVDWATVGTAIIAIAALKAAPLVVAVGSKMILRMIGR